MSNSDEFIDALIATVKAQSAARKHPRRYYAELLKAREDVPTYKAAQILATARMLIADQDAEITRLRAQLAECCDSEGTDRNAPAS